MEVMTEVAYVEDVVFFHHASTMPGRDGEDY